MRRRFTRLPRNHPTPLLLLRLPLLHPFFNNNALLLSPTSANMKDVVNGCPGGNDSCSCGDVRAVAGLSCCSLRAPRKGGPHRDVGSLFGPPCTSKLSSNVPSLSSWLAAFSLCRCPRSRLRAAAPAGLQVREGVHLRQVIERLLCGWGAGARRLPAGPRSPPPPSLEDVGHRLVHVRVACATTQT